jgi:hypothetical protein
MAELAFFIDAPTFTNATAIYSDSALTVLSPDGYYSDGAVSRQLINGTLGASVTCSACSGPPGGSANYIITQNINNTIIGDPLDYTLSGTGVDVNNPGGSVTQQGTINTPYNFIITAVPNAGKKFSSSSPFAATNPNGNIGNVDKTVTNTLSGTLINIGTEKSTTFYRLDGCGGSNGEFPTGGWIERTVADKPVAGQRYIASNVEPSQYFVFNEATTPQNNIPVSDQLEGFGGRGLVLEKIDGETGCPTENVVNTISVELTKCSDGTSDYYLNIPSGIIFLTGTRVTNNNGATIYTMGTILFNQSQFVGKTQLTNVKYINAQGVVEGDPNFTAPVIGCPGAIIFYSLKSCTDFYASRRVTSQTVDDPLFSLGSATSTQNGSGSVYQGKDGECYELEALVTNPAPYISSTKPAVKLTDFLGNDCAACGQQV